MSDDFDALAVLRDKRAEEASAADKARRIAAAAAVAEVARLRQLAAEKYPDRAAMIDDPEVAVHGYAPGYGPEATAEQLERVWGPLESRPGWFNARQFAEAAADYTRARSEDQGMSSEEARRHSQFLMSPERYWYMQQGPGRAVDLLKQLRDDPEAAAQFWEKSKGARTTRNDYNDANYARHSGFEAGAQEFLSSPLSPIGRYLQWQNIVPSAVRHWTGGEANAPGGALGTANAMNLAQQRYRRGENPILDIATSQPGETADDRRRRWAARDQQIQQDVEALSPPTDDELARNAFGKSAPAAAGTALGFLTGLLDGTAPVSLVSNLAKAPALWLARTARQAVTGTTGVGSRAAGAMIDRASRAFPKESVLAHGARVAGYRGIPASVYAEALRRPTLTNVIPRSIAGAVSEEVVPEVAIESAIGAGMSQPGRTTSQWLTSPAVPATDDEYRQRQDAKRTAAEQAAIRTEVQNDQVPNEIWNEFMRAQSAFQNEAYERAMERARRSKPGWDFQGGP